MKQPTHSGLVEWLAIDEEKSRDRRARRLKLLLDTVEIGDGFTAEWGGTLGFKIFEEIRLCYIQSLDIAVILLVISYFEHSIASQLYAAGCEDAKILPSNDLFLMARQHSILTNDEYTALDRLRKSRNSYVHFRPPGTQTSILYRSVKEYCESNHLIENDTNCAIKVLGKYVSRNLLK